MIEWLPWVAFIAAVMATGTAWLERSHTGPFRPWTRMLTGTAVAAALATFMVLVWLFLKADVRYAYVFLYTHAELPLRYRLAGAWAGREGSLALWALYAAIVAALAANRWRRDEAHRWSLVVLSGLGAAFLGAVAMSDIFAPTSQFFLQQRPLGNGLNPTLQSDFFLIHPPLMFLAYALTNVPVAAALGHLISGTGKWSDVAEPSARLNWLLYTGAMGLGGIWAYYTLGFGGFWAWDPVEVANLLPWLGLTIYLHAQRHHKMHRRYRHIGPLLAVLPFLLTLFSTISTRSGLWVSVHAFTDPTQTFNPDAVGRFLDILNVETTLAFPVGLLLAVMCLTLALWSRRMSVSHHTFARSNQVLAGLFGGFAVLSALAPVTAYTLLADAGTWIGFGRTGTGMLVLFLLAIVVPALPLMAGQDEGKLKLDLQHLNYASILILGAGLLVLWLWHMAAANGWTTEFYEARLPFLAAPAVLAMLVFMGLPWGRVWLLRILVGTVAISVVAALRFGPGAGLLVGSAVLFIAAVDRTRRAATASAPTRLQVARWLLVVGAFLDLLFWLNPPTFILGFRVGIWPAQLVGGALALWAFDRALGHTASHGRDGPTRWLVGLLGGFYIAPVLAIVAAIFARGVPSVATFKPQRLQQAGLYLVHLAVALALVGYSGATYFGDEERGELLGSATLAGVAMNHADTQVVRDGQAVDEYQLLIETEHGMLSVPMRWESSVGAYYPLPATLRTWSHEIYVSIDSMCLAPCDDALDEIKAYQPTHQRATMEVSQASLSVHVLPALGLVWTSLALFVYGMGLLMWASRPAQSGIALSTGGST